MKATSFLSGLVCALVGAAAAQGQVLYTVTDLGDLPGGSNWSEATGINEAGQVVGYSNASTGLHAFLWDPVTEMMQDLGELPGGLDFSRGMNVNDAGEVQVAGYSVGTDSDGTDDRAMLWDAVNGMQNLGDLPGSIARSRAFDLNDAGQVTGRGRAGTGDRAFLWLPAPAYGLPAGMNDLGDLPGGQDQSQAAAINTAGQVAGYSGYDSGDGWGTHAFLWLPAAAYGLPAGMNDLGDLPGGYDNSYGFGMNDAGQVVGRGSTEAGLRAFLWDPVNGMQDLGEGEARDVNDAGQVVGAGAFVWDSVNGMRDPQ